MDARLEAQPIAGSHVLVPSIKELIAAAKAYRELATVYRLGARPSEALFKRLDKARKTLEKVDAS